MKLQQYLLLSIIFFCPIFLIGQDVTLEITTTPSTCFANGKISIALKGKDIDKLSQISYTAIHTSTQDSYFNGANPVIENLPKGNYSVVLKAYFLNTTPIQKTGTTTVGGNYIAPTAFKVSNADLIGTRKTFRCRNTGRVSLEITGGTFPYIIETYLNSIILKKDTFNTYQNTGTNINLPDFKNYYNIENLPAGNYTFKITDGCNYELPDITETISSVAEDFHCFNMAITSTNQVNHYNIVNINFGEVKENNDDLYKYYYDQVYRNIPWWEFTYSFDGGAEKNWKNIPPAWTILDTIVSATKYCDLWNKSYQIITRVKNCTENACKTLRKIEYSGTIDLSSHNIFDSITGCIDEMKMRLFISFHSPVTNEFFTAPIYYKITDIISGEVLANNSSNTRNWIWAMIVDKSKIGDKLLITVTDTYNCSLINNTYQIPAPPDNNWGISYQNRICSSASDYDQIVWTWNECINSQKKPPADSKIELLESPKNNYYHFVATYNRNQDKWIISQDNSSEFTVSRDTSCSIKLQGKDLASGTYRWQITDYCGRNDVIQVNYEFYSYEFEEPFSFDTQVTCEGKRYYPKVKLVAKRKDDGLKKYIPVRFDVSGVTGGYAPASGVCGNDYVTLTRPGDYQMNFNMYGTAIPCLIPTKLMTYAYNNLSLKNVYGYACNNGIDKVIKIVATVDSTTGMPPFKFDIFKENGAFITSNTTGIFRNIGAPDSTLLIKITDRCGASISNQRVKITNLQSGTKVAFAENSFVCLGNAIQLLGFSVMGAEMGYHWTGPDMFASQIKDPRIDSTTLNNEGFYVLSISGLECSIKDSIYITIIPPDTGYIADFACRGAPYNSFGFDIAPLDIPDTTYIFYNSELQTSAYKCDSTACLYLTIRDYASFTIDSVKEICADEPYFILPCHFYDEPKFFYNIQFNDLALRNGFQNVDSGTIIQENYIEVAIPHGTDKQNYVMPHNQYGASIFVNNGKCNSHVFEFPIQISYPNWIIEQKWNDVLTLLNKNYNGDYTFSKYEWFKNGKKLEGESNSYIYILPTLDFGAEYRALLTRTSDGEAVFTCPFKPEYRSGVKVYPQLVAKNEPICIETQHAGTALVWNILGQKIAQHPIYDNQINKIYVNETGFFIVEIITLNEMRQSFKIVIK